LLHEPTPIALFAVYDAGDALSNMAGIDVVDKAADVALESDLDGGWRHESRAPKKQLPLAEKPVV
jgi:hypothetical protein